MEWSLILADLPPRVRQEVEAMQNVIDLLKQQVAKLEQERDEARAVARELCGEMAYMGDYLFCKHWWHDVDGKDWLRSANPFPEGSPYFPDTVRPKEE